MTAPMSEPGPQPLVGRQRSLVRYLRAALVLAALAAVVELLVPAEGRTTAGRVMVGVLVLAPLGRVLWLAVRWARRRDVRFALVALALLAVATSALFVR